MLKMGFKFQIHFNHKILWFYSINHLMMPTLTPGFILLPSHSLARYFKGNPQTR